MIASYWKNRRYPVKDIITEETSIHKHDTLTYGMFGMSPCCSRFYNGITNYQLVLFCFCFCFFFFREESIQLVDCIFITSNSYSLRITIIIIHL